MPKYYFTGTPNDDDRLDFGDVTDPYEDSDYGQDDGDNYFGTCH